MDRWNGIIQDLNRYGWTSVFDICGKRKTIIILLKIIKIYKDIYMNYIKSILLCNNIDNISNNYLISPAVITSRVLNRPVYRFSDF